MNAARKGKSLADTSAATFAHLLAIGYKPIAIYASGMVRNPKKPDELTEGKEPKGKMWGLKDWTIDDFVREDRRCREQVNRGAGVGICLGPGRGPGGRWLIDLEGDGPEAEDSRLKLFGGEVVSSMAWSSRRGNHQVFVTDPDKLAVIVPDLKALEVKDDKGRIKTGVFKSDQLPGLELRLGGFKTDGKIKQVQSVVPPTIGVDNKPRAWIGPLEAVEVPEAFYRTLAGLILPKAAKPKSVSGSHFAGRATGGETSADDRWAQVAFAGEVDKLAATGQGGRNEQLNRSAHALGQLVPRYLARSTVEGALRATAERIGLGSGETEATIASGIEAGMAQPRTRPERPANPKPAIGPRIHQPTEDEGQATDQPVIDGVEDHRFNLTDLGNAERLVMRHGESLRYCHPWKRWLVYDGRRWSLDNTGAPRRRAKATVRAIYSEASETDPDSKRKELAKWAMESEKRDRISAMLTLAEAEPAIPILPEHMDVDPWIFNVANGTIDLKTGQLRPHDRLDLITKMSPVAYDPTATCPLWDSTLDLFFAGQSDLIEYFQKICGYAMAGVVGEQIMPIAYGKGANGKSTMLNAIMDVFGTDYAMKCPPDMLMAKLTDSHPTDRADLFRKRLVVAIETEAGRDLNETMVKELTGSDKIRARRMREDFWEFDPTHTLILATNHKPQIHGSDDGIWRRLKLIPFAVRMLGKSADKKMADKLKAEYPGILVWCVRGCLKWQVEGLDDPLAVVQASSEYRAQQDVIGEFLEAETFQNVQLRVKAGDLFARYQEWCKASNEVAMTMMKFGLAIEERDIEKTRSGGIWYLGLQIKPKESPKKAENSHSPFAGVAT